MGLNTSVALANHGGLPGMKVLHVIPSLSPVHGGPSVALPIMERALTDKGITVETATTDDDGLGEHCLKPLGLPVCENGVTRWYFAKQTEFYKISRPLRRWLRSEIGRFDLVHVHAVFSFTSVVAARAARRHHVPYILRPLGVLSRYAMTHRRAVLKRLSWKWIERPLLRDAAAVHFTSEDERSEAELLGVPLRSAVIPLGLETPKPGDREAFLDRFPKLREKVILLFLSRIDPKKNIESLLHATASLRTEFPNLRLIIAGDGAPEYVKQVQQLSRELQLGERAQWLGRVAGDLKSDLLAASQLFVLPSFSENFGIAVLEAMFAGLPCVVTPGVAIGNEINVAGAGKVVAPDPAGIATGLRQFLNDRQAMHDAGEKALRLALERFSATTMADQLVRLYRDIVATSGEKAA